MTPTIIHTEHYGIDRSLENHMRRQMQRMLEAGFNDYHRQFIRSALEEAYQYGYRAGRAKAGPITEDVIMRGIAEDIILKSAAQ